MRSFSITEAVYLEGCRLSARRTPLRTTVGAVLPGAIVLLVFLFHFKDPVSVSVLAGLGTAAGIALSVALVERTLIPWRARRLYEQHKGLHSPIEFSWTPEAVHLKAESGESTTPWSHYRRFQENDSVILLYLNDSMYHVIPKSVFLSESELSAFREACRVHT